MFTHQTHRMSAMHAGFGWSARAQFVSSSFANLAIAGPAVVCAVPNKWTYLTDTTRKRPGRT